MLKIYKIIDDLKSKYNSKIVFDTRLLRKNDIFIGLKTKYNDGNLHYRDAIKKKASLVIVNIKSDHPKLLYVKDSHLFIKNFCKFIINTYKGKIVAVRLILIIHYILMKLNHALFQDFKRF